jgi:hypothetical protein
MEPDTPTNSVVELADEVEATDETPVVGRTGQLAVAAVTLLSAASWTLITVVRIVRTLGKPLVTSPIAEWDYPSEQSGTREVVDLFDYTSFVLRDPTVTDVALWFAPPLFAAVIAIVVAVRFLRRVQRYEGTQRHAVSTARELGLALVVGPLGVALLRDAFGSHLSRRNGGGYTVDIGFHPSWPVVAVGVLMIVGSAVAGRIRSADLEQLHQIGRWLRRFVAGASLVVAAAAVASLFRGLSFGPTVTNSGRGGGNLGQLFYRTSGDVGEVQVPDPSIVDVVYRFAGAVLVMAVAALMVAQFNRFVRRLQSSAAPAGMGRRFAWEVAMAMVLTPIGWALFHAFTMAKRLYFTGAEDAPPDFAGEKLLLQFDTLSVGWFKLLLWPLWPLIAVGLAVAIICARAPVPAFTTSSPDARRSRRGGTTLVVTSATVILLGAIAFWGTAPDRKAEREYQEMIADMRASSELSDLARQKLPDDALPPPTVPPPPAALAADAPLGERLRHAAAVTAASPSYRFTHEATITHKPDGLTGKGTLLSTQGVLDIENGRADITTDLGAIKPGVKYHFLLVDKTAYLSVPGEERLDGRTVALDVQQAITASNVGSGRTPFKWIASLKELDVAQAVEVDDPDAARKSLVHVRAPISREAVATAIGVDGGGIPPNMTNEPWYEIWIDQSNRIVRIDFAGQSPNFDINSSVTMSEFGLAVNPTVPDPSVVISQMDAESLSGSTLDVTWGVR